MENTLQTLILLKAWPWIFLYPHYEGFSPPIRNKEVAREKKIKGRFQMKDFVWNGLTHTHTQRHKEREISWIEASHRLQYKLKALLGSFRKSLGKKNLKFALSSFCFPKDHSPAEHQNAEQTIWWNEATVCNAGLGGGCEMETVPLLL